MADRDRQPAVAQTKGGRIENGRIEERIRSARDSLPNRRDDRPNGALGGVPPDPQADENREPPAGAPIVPPWQRQPLPLHQICKVKETNVSNMKVVGQAPVMGEIHEVRATFATPDLMQNAVTQLEMSGFDRADLSLPEVTRPDEFTTPESSAKPADTEEDARQARTLQTSAAAAIAAMAAGGAVIATGGAVAPALAAAVVGGGMFGSAAYAISSASNSEEQEDRERKAATGTLVLSVRAPSDAKRADAEAILRSSAATSVQTR
jgi:hypothetical protein